MKLKIQQLVYMTLIDEAILKNVELVVVSVNQEDNSAIACDRDGDSYDIEVDEHGNYFIPADQVGTETIVTEQHNSFHLVQESYFLDRREEEVEDDFLKVFGDSIMFNMLFAPENFGTDPNQD